MDLAGQTPPDDRLRDPTGLRPPGFLEIDLTDETVSVIHHAWTGSDWSILPMVQGLRLFAAAPAVNESRATP